MRRELSTLQHRDLQFVTALPIDNYFGWQVHLWLESLKELNLSDKATVLLFHPLGREMNDKWGQIMDLYPEAEFKVYKDDGSVSLLLGDYIPILRPWVMMKYCEEHPEIKDKAVFYCDSDILFTEHFNIDHLVDDDVCYLSDTNSYINASYFDSKVRDVLPNMLEEYKKIDVLDTAAKMVGINRQICEKNNLHSGGTQYLLKNIDADLWKAMFELCIPVKKYLMKINSKYFGSENKGIQSWCIDMWVLLWTLWKREQECKVVKEMDFAWATDNINKISSLGIFHNAGVTANFHGTTPFLYKGKYHQGNDPTKDPHLDAILNNEESKKHCTWWYANKLKELSNKYKLNY